VGDTPHRNPTLSFRLSGLFLLRFAARALFRLLFHDPPRSVSDPAPSNGREALCYDLFTGPPPFPGI